MKYTLQSLGKNLQLVATLLIAVVFTVSSIPSTSAALSEKQREVYDMGINYYDIDACTVAPPTTTTGGGGSPIYMMGDSITAGAKTALEVEFQAVDLEVAKIDGVGSRSFVSKGDGPTNGLEALNAGEADIKKAKTVILALGTNGEDAAGKSSVFENNAKEALSKVRAFNPGAKIYWVNLISQPSKIPHKAAYNSVIRGLEGVTVIDADSANIPLSDGVHPSAAGYKKYAKTVARTVQATSANQSEGTDRSSAGIDLASIAKSNNIHSIALRKVGTRQAQYYNAGSSPNAVASTIKLIIVDAVLSSGIELEDRVKIEGQAYYGLDDEIKKGQTVTVRQAIAAALGGKSSNNGANALIKAAGGPEAVQERATELGYTDTKITSYFKDTSSSEVKNNSTARDVTQAMNTLYFGSREGDEIAQQALQQSSNEDGGGYHLNSEANKWGLRNNPPVRANSAVFAVGSTRYIITMYTNEAKESNITEATKVILEELETLPASSQDTSEVIDPACCVEGNSTVLAGNGNEEKIWNYLVQEIGFNDMQAAAAMGNIEQESGFDPQIVNPSSGAYGIAQWYAGRHTALANYAASKGKSKGDLGIQLEFLKKELEGSYKTTVLDPMKASNNLAEATRIWLEKFEVPCIPGSEACDIEMDVRLPFANKWQNKFSGGAPGPASSNSGPLEVNSGCGNTSSRGFSTVDFKNKEELVKMILDNKNILWGNYGPASSQKADVQSCLSENTLVALQAMASQSGAKIPINALASDHGGCSGGSSLHNSGRAIDIGYFGNGNSRHTEEGDKLYTYLYNNRKALKIEELIWQEPPSGMKCVDSLEATDCYATYGAATMNNHWHHIHVGFK